MVKSDAENRIPVVPLLVLLLVKNAPPTVAVDVMLKDAGEPELLMTDGLALVAEPNEQVGRLAWL